MIQAVVGFTEIGRKIRFRIICKMRKLFLKYGLTIQALVNVEEQEVEWGKFLNALNSGDYTLAEATDEKEVLKSGNPEKEILDLKEKLLETDYKALKYAEGVLTESEYEPIKQRRQEWRRRINELEKELQSGGKENVENE